jgi:hypothetical protein
MRLKIAVSGSYKLCRACHCPKSAESACGINYRAG